MRNKFFLYDVKGLAHAKLACGSYFSSRTTYAIRVLPQGLHDSLGTLIGSRSDGGLSTIRSLVDLELKGLEPVFGRYVLGVGRGAWDGQARKGREGILLSF